MRAIQGARVDKENMEEFWPRDHWESNKQQQELMGFHRGITAMTNKGGSGY